MMEPARSRWTALLAQLTAGFVRAIPPDGSPAWPHLPGADPRRRTTGMEGFARMSVAWGAWLGGPDGATPLRHEGHSIDVLDLVVRGLRDGTDPSGPWFWGHIGDREQRIVEAAELAFALWTGRDRLVPALGEAGTRQVLGWLAEVHGRDVYADNWVLFPSIVAAVSRGLGWAVDDRLIDEGIDRMLAWDRGDGWYSDGEGHAFDRYTGWAVHWHLLHWADIDGDRRPRVRDRVRASARTWLADLPAFAAADGAIPFFGRSLGYRFATAAPLGLAATLDQLPIEPGLARGIIDRSIGYHLEHGAIDPATDWFRVGVWGERPEVCERYMSSGASAWATRALVPLMLGPENPFWADPDPGLPVGAGSPVGASAEGPPVDLVLRGPGFLVGREEASGATWVASALMDHPDDIPGHDYRPSYGKWLYHAALPFTDHAADGAPGPDGALVLESPDGTIGHRGLVDAGGVGPSWTWSRYRVATGATDHGASVVSLRRGRTWVRAIGLRPEGPVRAVIGSLPLGVADAAAIRRHRDPDAAIASATDGDRWVAIRHLAGDATVVGSGPARGGRDRNLVAEHAEQPSVVEPGPSRRTRLLAIADAAGVDGDPTDHLAALAALVATAPDARTLILRAPDGEVSRLSVAARPPRTVELDGWTVTGPALHMVRIGPGGAWLAGESVSAIAGAVRLDRPGPLELRRLTGGVILVGTTEGLAIDGGWSGPPGDRLLVREADGWVDAGRLERPGVIGRDRIRALQRRTGHAFLWLQMVS